jgi:AbrB family looped-hinge helix DNA binding protein
MKMHYSTITSKGQVTIPIEVREKFNLSTGGKIEFIALDDYIIVVPVNKSVTELKGILPKPAKSLSCKQMDKIIKGKHDRD